MALQHERTGRATRKMVRAAPRVYDIAVIHRRGCHHGNADALSRIGPDENEANITGGSSSKDMGVSAVQPQRLQTGTGDAKSMRQLQLEG